MKKLLFTFTILLFVQVSVFSQTTIDIGKSESMCITGKGAGQDAAKNPYSDTNSFAIIENIGQHQFDIRIQKKGEIITTITIKPKEIKKMTLLKNYELYFDSTLESKAKINFEKAKAY